ncbi:MAG: Mut7-C RNAse domain-containing protein [Proteobacteria bacterium]|nr:Mut7-C RNAse domain-containing protein [Pseudomonadota bacterium]
MSQEIKNKAFVVDTMLGRLAKWLRMFGFDVLYNPNFDDETIIYIGRKENRIIITKDKRLSDSIAKAGLKYIFIEDNDYRSQLKKIINLLNIKIEDISLFSRCVRCNSILKDVKKEEVEGLVPEFIFHTKMTFSNCETCGKIYWSGSHLNRIENLVKDLFKK